MTQRAEALLSMRCGRPQADAAAVSQVQVDLGASVEGVVARQDIPEDYDDVIFGCVDTVGRSQETSREPAGWQRLSVRCRARRLIGSVARPNRRCILRRRQSCLERWTSWWPGACRR